MPRDLFGDVTDPYPSLGSRKWYMVPLSLAAHALILLALVVAPLVATGALPLPASRIVFVPAVAPELPPAPAVRPVEPAAAPPGAERAAPINAPDTIAPEPSPVTRFDIQPPRKIVDVAPVYPPLAQSIGIEGLGVIEATIGVDGGCRMRACFDQSRSSTPPRWWPCASGPTRRRG